MMVRSKRDLLHAAVAYDPQKAHEYYLRNRKLKGRHPGTQVTALKPVAKAQTAAQKAKAAEVKIEKTQHHRLEVQQRVDALEKRFNRLHDILAELVKQAKARSGVETPVKKSAAKTTAAKKSSSKAAASSKSGGSSKSHQTAAQKKAAAKKAQAKYEKEHPGGLNSDPAVKAEQLKIDHIEAQIKKYRADLKAAAAQARKHALAKSKTASKGR